MGEAAALAYRFARASLARDMAAADPLRDEIVRRWGQKGLVALALALTTARMYPTLKYALGHGKTCSRVMVAGEPAPVRAPLAARRMSPPDPFEAERPRLKRLAYRMLGSVAEAEDVVQDAWLRWRSAKRDRRTRGVADPRGDQALPRSASRRPRRARRLSRPLAARAADRGHRRRSGRAGRGRFGRLPAGARAALAAGAGGLPAARRVRHRLPGHRRDARAQRGGLPPARRPRPRPPEGRAPALSGIGRTRSPGWRSPSWTRRVATT